MPPPAGASFFSSGISETMASVVRSSDAIDDAFCSAERTTFVRSMGEKKSSLPRWRCPAQARFSCDSVQTESREPHANHE